MFSYLLRLIILFWTQKPNKISMLSCCQRLLAATPSLPIDLQYTEDPPMNYAITAPLTKGWMPESIHPAGQQSSFV